MSCISSDCNNNEMLPASSATDINIFFKEASFDTLSGFVNICNNIELFPVPAYNNTTLTSPSSPTKEELRALLKKQKEEIEVLQRQQEVFKKIVIKSLRGYFAVKAQYNKYKLKLWHSEQNRVKSKLLYRFHPDQLRALERQSKRGIKWSPETIKDALVFRMKWGTAGFSDFVNYLPIFQYGHFRGRCNIYASIVAS